MSTTTTGIDWTDRTWNPLRGCTRVSAGCQHCYAETLAYRFSGPGQPYEGLVKMTNGHPQWTGEIRLVESAIEEPLHWRKPARIFVNSMSDLFHPSVPNEFIDRVFNTMMRCPQHTFQVLTKRPDRMQAFVWWWTGQAHGDPVVPAHIWLGTSVESQEHIDRIAHLRDTRAAMRFLSCEPLLGPLLFPTLSGIGWVIAGGESGPGARPMHPDWVRSVRNQCVAAGVPFFFKQAGKVLGAEWGCSDSHGADMNAWQPDLRIREFPVMEASHA